MARRTAATHRRGVARHWDDFSLTEAAAILGVRPGTSRTRYQRARERMARTLEPQLTN